MTDSALPMIRPFSPRVKNETEENLDCEAVMCASNLFELKKNMLVLSPPGLASRR